MNNLKTFIIFVLALSLFFLGRRKYYGVFMFYICVIMLLFTATASFFTSSLYKGNIGLFFIAFPFIGQSFKSGINHIKNAMSCKKNITAKYIGSIKLKNSDQSDLYSMVFSYPFGSNLYEQKTKTKYKRSWIAENFRTNRNYDIFIDPQNPNLIITNRLSEFLEGSIILLISALLLVLPMISLFSMMTMFRK